MSKADDRRNFIKGSTLGAAGLLLAGRAAAQPVSPSDASRDEFPRTQPGIGGPTGSASDRGKLTSGLRSPEDRAAPCITPDIPDLPFEMKNGVKEFHLTAQHLERELLPDKWFDFWGYNDSMPGPTIQAVEGDRVRIVVHNELPESTTLHCHGFELPNRMDGVEGLLQDPIKPQATYTYEFDIHQHGTFFYHSHGPMQESLGMIGLFIVHPRQAYTPVCDRDFGLIFQEFSIRPKSTVPDTMSDEFNFFTINGRAGPYITPLVVQLGERVRIRMMNLSPMDNHPIHLHGHTFWVTGTEGGRIPESAWIPGNTVMVGIGQSRDVEFIANNPGDWLLHCHILHHMMNHMTPMVGPTRIVDEGPLETLLKEDPRYEVPGFPQDMMDLGDMLEDYQIEMLEKPETAGMRRNWHRGVMGMMTVVRVLEPEQFHEYERAKAES